MVKKVEGKGRSKFIVAVLSVCLALALLVPSGKASALGTTTDRCKKGAGILGYALCPIIDGFTELGETLYKGVKAQLTIKTVYFNATNSQGDESGIHKVWGVARDISNVVFAILFLVVIFSQLTGIGIDNYGIKKILPRLIIVAITVNLSFIICQLLVDLSNVVGNSIDGTLADLANSVPSNANYSGLEYVAMYAGDLALATYITAMFPVMGLGIIIALIVILCMIISAMITLFFIVIVRNIGVVIAITLAPLAFVCLLLPNTERLFKKWVNFFKALLIVFPICTFAVGSGSLVGAIIGSSLSEDAGESQYIEALLAMLAPVLPYFFVPKMLKGSLASLTFMGKAVSDWRTKRGLGRKRRAKKALQAAKSSQAYKSAVNSVKLKAASSAAGKKTSSALNKWAGTTGAGLGAAAKRGLGSMGVEAISGMVTGARQQQVSLERQQKERQLWSDTTMSGQYIDSAGNISSVAAAGSRQLTKGELYAAQMSKAGQAQFENAQIKTYAEQNANQSKDQNAKDIVDAINSNNPERFAAAFRTLLSQGGKEEALRAIYDNPAAMSDPRMRSVVEREMGSSGLTFMKEYGKYRAGGGTGDFATFVSGGSLASQLEAKGETAIAGLDKDEYAFLAYAAGKTPGAFRDGAGNVRLSSAMLARGAASLSTSDQAAKYNQFLHAVNLNDFEQQSVVDELSFEQSATMFESTRAELSSAVPGKTNDVDRVRDRFNRPFGTMSANKAQYAGIIGKMRDSDRTNYIS